MNLEQILKNMDNDLKQAIDENLFLPLNEEMYNQLYEVSSSLVTSIDDAKFTSYVHSIFQTRCGIDFKIKFQTKYKEMFGVSLELPSIVFLVLQTYVIFLVFQSEDIENSRKVYYSLIVKNYAVLRKGSWEDLICQNWVVSMYSYYKRYAPKAIDTSKSYTDLLNSVVPSDDWDGTALEISDVNVYNQLRSLCAAGYRGRLSSFIENEPFVGLDSPFAQIYLLAKKMVIEWNWKYISTNPSIKFSEVFRENGKRRKKISKIIDDIYGSLKENDIYKPSKESSVILKCISTKQYLGLHNQMFSVLEFGIYLYYELMSETLK